MADTTTTPPPTAVIDETSIAPNRPGHQRQESLEKHLLNRPDPKELKEKHILLDINAAPSLQAAALELERQKVSDSLKKGLEKRAEREDLIERNILPHSTAAPSLLAHQKELEKHMKADTLNEKLAHRPSPEKLLERGILDADPTSPVEGKGGDQMSYEEKMEEEYAKREGGA